MSWKINSKLLAPKAHYLLYFGGKKFFWLNFYPLKLGFKYLCSKQLFLSLFQ